jgi:hypothetical protein
MTTAKLEATIQGLGEVFYVDAPFDVSLEELRSAGAEPIYAKQLAYARAKVQFDHSLNKIGSYVREGMLIVPAEKKTILIRYSPLLVQKMAKYAVYAHGERKNFSAIKKEFDKYQDLANSNSPLVYILKNKTPIPTNRFDDDRAVWLFGENAKPFGDYLQENGIPEMPIDIEDDEDTCKSTQPHFNQLWFYRINGVGYLQSLHACNRVRGVRSNEGNTQSSARKEELASIKNRCEFRLLRPLG